MTRLGQTAGGYSKTTKDKRQIELGFPEYQPTPQSPIIYEVWRFPEGTNVGNIGGKIIRTVHCDRCHKMAIEKNGRFYHEQPLKKSCPKKKRRPNPRAVATLRNWLIWAKQLCHKEGRLFGVYYPGLNLNTCEVFSGNVTELPTWDFVKRLEIAMNLSKEFGYQGAIIAPEEWSKR
jgi:hypothetical protein